MNSGKYNTDELKIQLALLFIGGKAKQWKRNMYKDLNDEMKTAYLWNNWATFKTNFKNNWGEIDSPETAITKIYKLHKQKKKISIPKYIQLFKECI